MSKAPRPARRNASKRPRRPFDRSIAVARYRWEILRRTADYRTDVSNVIGSIAKAIGCTKAQLERDCLDGGGIILPVFSDEHYDKICARYRLRALIHPAVPFSDDEMAAFPVFADTPKRQRAVRDRILLRRVAIRGEFKTLGFSADIASSSPAISPQTQRRMFGMRPVDAGPFQLKINRIRFTRLDTMLAVFDAHTEGKPFSRIANELGLSLDQAKRAWQTGRRLISRWFDFEPHLGACKACQQYVRGERDRMCAKAELQIGLRRTGGSRLRPMGEQTLDLLHARRRGELPARRSFTEPDSRQGERSPDV